MEIGTKDESSRHADIKTVSKIRNVKEVKNTMFGAKFEVGASSKATLKDTLEEQVKGLETHSTFSLQAETKNTNKRIFIVSEEGEIHDHLENGLLSTLECNTQIENHEAWGDEKTNSEIEVREYRMGPRTCSIGGGEYTQEIWYAQRQGLWVG